MTEENTIDEKKGEDTKTKSDIKGFIKNYLVSIIFTIGICIFVIGTIGLYTTKVAQANILPDNIDLAPYTNIDRVVHDIPIDINITKPSMFAEAKDSFSQKAFFHSKEYLESFKKSFMCKLRENAQPGASAFSNAPLYFANVYENMMAKNFLAINTIFLYLSYLPESLIMMLYGLLGILLWLALYFFNICIGIFYHLVSIPQLFRDVSEADTNKWESNKDISLIRITKMIMFFFIWLPVGCISAFISPLFFTLYGLMAPLFSTYEIKQTNKTSNIFDFIKDTFVYKKLLFFILATVSLFSNGYKYLGPLSLVGIVIAVLFAYFMGLYSNDVDMDNLTQRIRQSVKQSALDIDKNNLVDICKPIPTEDVSNGSISNGTISGGSMQQGGSKYKFRIV
jgi:hypothetical protein